MPTRITNHSATIIDHIYYYEGKHNNCDFGIKSGNLLADITDHLANFFLITKKTAKKDLQNRPFIRLFSKRNKLKFCRELNSTNWQDLVYSKDDPNAAFDSFNDAIDKSFNHCFPLVKLSIRGLKDKKWMTTALKKSSRQKNNLYKIFMNARNKNDEDRYTKFKATFEKVSKQAEITYYNKIFDTRCSDLKKCGDTLILSAVLKSLNRKPASAN